MITPPSPLYWSAVPASRGPGSIIRTLIGAAVIAVIEVVLLLRGFSEHCNT